MQFKTSSGFTLIEILMVMVISVTLVGLITVSFLRTKQTTSINNSVNKIISDMNSQQLKAMAGSTDGAINSSAYGIYFTQDSYVLFRGSSYSPTDPANISISLDQNINISNISFPGNTIIYSQQSGEISGFNPSSNRLTVNNISANTQRTITINRYGVLTSISQ